MNKDERQTFKKNERLCRTRLINEIFETGNVFHTKAFRVSWIVPGTNLPSPAQVVISVPKKSFRLAVKRNLIKRRIKEAYRKNKHILYNFLASEKLNIAFIMIYRGTEIPDYTSVEKSVNEIILKLCDDIRKKLVKC